MMFRQLLEICKAAVIGFALGFGMLYLWLVVRSLIGK